MRWARRAWTTGLLTALLLSPLVGLLGLTGFPGGGPRGGSCAEAAPVDAAGRWRNRQPLFTVVLVGSQAGKLKPCGCVSPQLGGLERWPPLFEPLRARAKGALALLSVGGMAPRFPADTRASTQLRLKADFYRAVLRELQFDAALLSVHDLYVPELVTQFDGPESREVDRPRPPLNVKPSARLGLNPAVGVVPWVELRLGDVPVRLLSVIDERHADDLKAAGIADYVSTPATVLQGLQPNPGVLWIVAVEGGSAAVASARDAMRLLGPAVVVDLDGATSPAPHEFVVLGQEPLVVAFQEKGMAVGVLDIDPGPDGKGWTVSFHPEPLGPDLDAAPSPSRAAVSSLFSFYRGQVREQGLLALERRDEEPSGAARFVGAAKCAKCHSGIYQQWLRTPHAKALRTLKEHDYEWDPECLTCHVVGPQRQLGATFRWASSGFRDPTVSRHLGGVGCESCHGPGSLHVAEPWNKAHFAPGGPNRRHPQERGCATCHDPDNSPGFAQHYAERLTHVDHREVPPEQRTHEPPTPR